MPGHHVTKESSEACAYIRSCVVLAHLAVPEPAVSFMSVAGTEIWKWSFVTNDIFRRLFLEHVPHVFAALQQTRDSVKSVANGDSPEVIELLNDAWRRQEQRAND